MFLTFYWYFLRISANRTTSCLVCSIAATMLPWISPDSISKSLCMRLLGKGPRGSGRRSRIDEEILADRCRGCRYIYPAMAFVRPSEIRGGKDPSSDFQANRKRFLTACGCPTNGKAERWSKYQTLTPRDVVWICQNRLLATRMMSILKLTTWSHT